MGMGFRRKFVHRQLIETHPHPNPPLEREGIYSSLLVKDIIPDSSEIESDMTVGRLVLGDGDCRALNSTAEANFPGVTKAILAAASNFI